MTVFSLKSERHLYGKSAAKEIGVRPISVWWRWRESAHGACNRVPRQHFIDCFCRLARCTTQLALLASTRDIISAKQKRTHEASSFCLVEMAGVEPASEDQLPRLSTSVAGLLAFPPCSAERQALHFGSLSCMAELKAWLCARAPLIDALIPPAVLRVRTAA